MKKDLFIITIIFSLVSIFFFIFSRFTRGGMDSVYKAWDGPSYIIAARSLYDPNLATTYNSIHSPDIRPDFTFLPAHFPLYPLLIRLFSSIGYSQAMLFISLTFSLFTLYAFYLLATELKIKNPLLLTLPMIILPPRWFIISHTGSSEPIFFFFILCSLLLYFRRSPYLSAVMASFAMLARPQGVLFGIFYFVLAIVELYKSRDLKVIISRYLPYIMIPFTLLGIFLFYRYQTGDFLAFFNAISIFHHFNFSLFPSFNFGAPNIETFWQEANAIYLVVYLGSIISLFNTKYWQISVFGIIFYLPLLFLQHSDISRYALPLMPVMFIALREIIANRSFNLASLLSLPAIFLYASNFILFNRAP